MIAPVGKKADSLFIGIREFLTEKVILLTPENKSKIAEIIKNDLNKFKIPCDVIKIKENIWEEMFQKISEIKNLYKDKNLIINTSTGDEISACAATSAAFVNGLKAFAIAEDKIMPFPILKFSYYKLLTDKKLKILDVLAKDKTCCKSLEELSKKTRMSLPLISYHVNGNLKSEGLIDLGLVETSETGGKIAVNLTTLGRMIIKGYIK